MKINVSITQKHFVYFLFLSIVSIFLVTFYSYHIEKNTLLDRTFNHLASVRVEKAKNLERYFQDRIIEVKILSEPNKFQSIFFNYHKDFETDFFRMYFERFINTNNYYRKIVFLDANNKLLVINKSGYPNTQISNNQYQFYIKISKDIATNTIQLTDYKTEDDSSFHFFIISKIFGKQQAKYLGTLVFDLFTTSINNIMFDYSQYNGLGNTGESYIVGQDFLMRTSSRFKENSINKIKVKTQASINAISGQTGQILTKDYRNVEVLSSYAPLKIAGLNWVIIAEMDLKEALKPIYNLRNSIVIISVILSLIIFILVYIGSKKITNPIIKLNEAATKISKGQFNVKIIPQSNDEIGELINSFNNMSNQLALQSEQIAKDKLFRISAVIDAQEVERQRLSRDIHDGLGQMLLAIKFKLEKIEKLSFGTVKSQVQETIYLIKNSINEIRAVSNNLMPNVLANFGLEEGIKRLCNDSLNSTHILCNFSFQSILHNTLDNRKQIYIFRIVQEIIHNIVKHSNANKTSVNINIGDEYIYINISDDGIGFDLNRQKTGNGVLNIFERVELLNGSVQLKTNAGNGTIYKIKIPIKDEKNKNNIS